MAILIFLAFLGASVIILWSAKVVVVDRNAGTKGRYGYIGISVIVAVVAYWTTNHYDYFPNANTHVHGWPVPVVVFQRDNATSPWLDYVGLTTLLGLPMNFIIFMLLPALVFMAAGTWKRWRFSLRTLLIATTVIAVVLGLIVWATT
jgi:hypothetical protein